MEEHFLHEKQVREYLLGFLSEGDRDQIETRLFSDDAFERFVDLIEDEIIDDYLDDRLPEEERHAVAQYFLRPPERQRKLSFARGLKRHIDARAGESLAGPSPPRLMAIPAPVWAAVIVLAIVAAGSGLYALKLSRGLQDAINAGRAFQADLFHERELTASLNRKIKELESMSIASQTTINLIPITSRTTTLEAPVIRRSMASPWIEAHIALTDTLRKSYSVTVETASGAELWYVRGLRPSTEAGGSELVFKVPTELLQPGAYTAVFAGTEDGPDSAKKKCKFSVLP